MERLAKYLARAGIASRRKCEELISAGRVTVNQQPVTEMGTRIDAGRDEVAVDGLVVKVPARKVYLMMHKPAGYITSVTDPFGRPTVMELLPPLKVRVFPVGRLDRDTEGLLFFTNDGDFAQAVMHPRHELLKTYEGRVKGIPTRAAILKLAQGIHLDGRLTAPAKIEILGEENGNAIFEMKVHEGRKRQIKRMWEAVGFPVLYLKRTAIGPVALGILPVGCCRTLRKKEIEQLLTASRLKKI